uniref:Uncharacterized protein n=1 Tax=Sphaerodactylus townsendi TaxID=933632 RepID=A0ACB8G9B2_9SAUR
MDCLKGEFEVEPGDGGSRCEYLKEKGIVTYLVIVPKQPLKNGINGVGSRQFSTYIDGKLTSGLCRLSLHVAAHVTEFCSLKNNPSSPEI